MATPFDGLEGEQRDVAVFLNDLFSNYGLGTLAPKILEFIKQGYDGNTVAILLQETPEYKQRFAANETRRAKGLPVLSPAEYLAVERSYRELLSSAGLPIGFYDQPEDFRAWIENDVAPAEIKQRVDVAVQLVNNIDPSVRSYFERWYSTGDMIAYALDRKRATAVIERQAAAAIVGGAATDQGLAIDAGLAERIAQTGINTGQARAGFGAVVRDRATAEKLGALYGEQYGVDDLVEEVFFEDAGAGKKRQRLASRERAAFSGSSAVNQRSLTRSTAGNV